MKQLTSPYRFFGAEETLGSKVAAGANDAELEAEGSGVPIDNKADRLRSFRGRLLRDGRRRAPAHAINVVILVVSPWSVDHPPFVLFRYSPTNANEAYQKKDQSPKIAVWTNF